MDGIGIREESGRNPVRGQGILHYPRRSYSVPGWLLSCSLLRFWAFDSLMRVCAHSIDESPPSIDAWDRLVDVGALSFVAQCRFVSVARLGAPFFSIAREFRGGRDDGSSVLVCWVYVWRELSRLPALASSQTSICFLSAIVAVVPFHTYILVWVLRSSVKPSDIPLHSS